MQVALAIMGFSTVCSIVTYVVPLNQKYFPSIQRKLIFPTITEVKI